MTSPPRCVCACAETRAQNLTVQARVQGIPFGQALDPPLAAIARHKSTIERDLYSPTHSVLISPDPRCTPLPFGSDLDLARLPSIQRSVLAWDLTQPRCAHAPPGPRPHAETHLHSNQMKRDAAVKVMQIHSEWLLFSARKRREWNKRAKLRKRIVNTDPGNYGSTA